jgi:serine/threonine protein kinase
VGDDHAWLEKVLIEVQLLQRLSHPNLVSYRHVWLEDVKLNRFGPSVPCAYILQQYCNSGDLLHYVIGKNGPAMYTKEQLKAQMRRRSKGHLERPQALKSQLKKLAFDEIYSFFKDITSGLAHLHAANYIHRDLKPSNCLLHKGENSFRCLISDFGEVQTENMVRKSTGATGTISYCAPEVLRQDSSGRYGNFTTKSDIFSLGMILYFMCFGRLPYVSAEHIQEEFEDLDQLRAEISSWQGFKDERQERPDLPDQLYSFLKRLLSINPSDRPSAHEILQAISTGSGLEGAPSLSRAKNHLGVGKRIHSVDSPSPGPLGQRASSAAYIEDESSEMDLPAPQIVATLPENEMRKPVPGHLESSSEMMTPLLMPPPSGYVETFKQRLALGLHEVYSWTVLNRRLLTYTTKLLIFLFKVYTLAKPCLPWATNPLVAYPLLMLAAFDFTLGARMEWRMTTILLVVHLVTLATASRYGSLCASGRDIWEWQEDLDGRRGIGETV